MSRSFVAASSQGLKGGGLIQAYPYSVSMWTKVTSIPAAGSVHFDLSDGTNNMYVLLAQATSKYSIVDSGGSAQATTSNTANLGAWDHLVLVFTSSSSRTIYLNGTAVSNSSAGGVGAAISGMNVSGVGMFWNGSITANYVDGLIAEFALYNEALTAADVTSLGAGCVPLRMRTPALRHYAPFTGTINFFTGSAFTDFNTSTNSGDNPRIYR